MTFHSSLTISNITIGIILSKKRMTLEGKSTLKIGKWIAIYRELIMTMKCSIDDVPEAQML